MLRYITIVGIFLFLTCLRVGHALEEAYPKVAPEVEFRILAIRLIPNLIGSIDNIPEEIRQVPGHRNDEPARDYIIRIPQDSVDPHFFASFNLPASLGVRVYRLKLRAGINLHLPLAPSPINSHKGSTREINVYTGGTNRGEGQSLVFYGLNAGTRFAAPLGSPGWFGEIEYRLSDHFSILGGYSLNSYKLEFKKGWDRYDELEVYKSYLISVNYLYETYMSLIYHDKDLYTDYTDKSSDGFYISIGRVTQKTSTTALGRMIQIDYNVPNYVIGFGLMLSLKILP